MVLIDVEIKKRSGLKLFLRKLHNKAEDVFFSLIQRLPERFITPSMLEWLERYTDKRIAQLKQEKIKATWKKLHLESALKEIHNREEAPTEE